MRSGGSRVEQKQLSDNALRCTSQMGCREVSGSLKREWSRAERQRKGEPLTRWPTKRTHCIARPAQAQDETERDRQCHSLKVATKSAVQILPRPLGDSIDSGAEKVSKMRLEKCVRKAKRRKRFLRCDASMRWKERARCSRATSGRCRCSFYMSPFARKAESSWLCVSFPMLFFSLIASHTSPTAFSGRTALARRKASRLKSASLDT